MKRMISGMGGRQQVGFTVIELLVTIAVLTIIISMGVPMYGQFSRSSEMSGRTTDLIASINLTRSEAVNQRRAIDMEAIDGNWSMGWIISRQLDGTVLRISDFRGAGVNTVGVEEGGGQTTLSFDREGRMASGGATFTLCPNDGKPGQGRTIAITGFGRVQSTQLACP